jgi:subtilase family serine protease
MLFIASCSSNSDYAPAEGRSVSSLQFPTSSYGPVCTGSRIARAQCDVLAGRTIDPAIDGITAPDIVRAYGLKQSGGKGQKVAIVDAYDNPNAASDLAAYRAYFDLPPANFTKCNQTGQTSNLPAGNTAWGVEEDLDVEMVSVGCPRCTIYLVEANSNGGADLSAAAAEAARLGATVVSNSYSGTGLVESDFDRKGVEYVASAGGAGYGHDIGFPAGYRSVVSVGGTELASATSKRGFTEVVWPATSAGCSSERKPSWQKDPGCATRTTNDVSAVAVGVDEYDTYGEGGWFAITGTSIPTPLIAGVFGEAGNASKQNGGRAIWSKKAQKFLYPVLVGNDGSCGGSYLCTAGTNQYGNYSGPAGWGSPHGDDAF